MILVNIRQQCLVCSAAQNIWRGEQLSFMLEPYYVYINGINSCGRIFCSHRPNIGLGKANRTVLLVLLWGGKRIVTGL